MKVLLVVDVQNDFVTGTLASTETQRCIPRIKEKIQQRINEGWHVIFTQDTHYDEYLATMEGKYLPVPHCIENTWGWQLVDEIKEFAESQSYTTITKNKFCDNLLYKMIRNRLYNISGEFDIIEIELIGFCTDICVVSNALTLKASVENTVISCDASCCAGTSIEAHKAALTVLKSCQVEVRNEETVQV